MVLRHRDDRVLVPEGFEANDVIKTAYFRYDLSLGTGLNKLNGKAFRIGHLGWLNEIMLMQTLCGVELAMRASVFHSSPARVPARRSLSLRYRPSHADSSRITFQASSIQRVIPLMLVI